MEIDVIEENTHHRDFNVTAAATPSSIARSGSPDIGFLVHCRRDHAMVSRFDPTVDFTRTSTAMEGASHCDFRFRKKPA
jgi:hypothetical protein